MIFLIEYNRPQGRIVTFMTFDALDRSKVEKIRLDVELDRSRRGINHEIVLLEAASEEALRRTHRRYFETLSQIVMSFTKAAGLR